MSVTRPTLKPEPLDDAADVVALDAPELPLLAVLAELVVLLLLLPHAASPRASVATPRATRPRGLIVPVTASPFPRYEWATITGGRDGGDVA
jgi:hypothetical protein